MPAGAQTDPTSGHRIALAVQLACTLEASAPKPGNISPGHDFVDTTYSDMVRSGLSLGPVLAHARDRGVGRLIADGVAASARVARANTNLGIVLLLAPIARAEATREEGEPLRSALERVLEALDVTDAAEAFAAIAAAQPGGLGEAVDHDVREPARIGLRDAMALAAERDRVASEYATGYAVVFDHALPRLDGLSLEAVVSLYIALLAEFPDTLIARKRGWEVAEEVSAAAREVRDGRRTLAELDAWLRAPDNGLNPGTTADLVCAALLAELLR